MFCNLKTVILGDYVKLTSINLKTSSECTAKINKKYYNHKLDNNLVRAKTRITEIALANNFVYFFTLTFKPLYDRYDLQVLLLNFRSHLRAMRNNISCDIKYLIVPEQHKNGAWHFHGFFTSDIDKFLYLNKNGFLSITGLDDLGYCNIQVIQNKVKISNYVTKYINKNIGKGINRYKHCYYASIGLSRGFKDLDLLYDNEFFNQKFFDFRNDYCFQKIIPIEEYKKLREILKHM